MIKILLSAAASVFLVTAALAHGGATGIVKQRMDGMMAMGKALKSVSQMLSRKQDFNAAKIGAAADIVKTHTQEIEALFPDTKASRNGKGTEATADVWTDRAGFLAIAAELEKRAIRLKELSAAGEKSELSLAFKELVKSCSACHADYRKKVQ